MCNKLCTYRKYIAIDPLTTSYNCNENPHIILSAREYGSTQMTSLAPTGNAANNLYSTNFHKFYLEILTAWTTQVQAGVSIGYISAVASPSLPTITQTGFLVGDAPTLPVNNALSIAETYNTYNISSGALFSGLINYSKPPFDFADNISASEYVPSYIYDQGELGFSTGGDPILLVEFLDVTGKYCQYA
jgi:hypothetical protein